MPCGGRCGTRPWHTAGRRGRRPWRGRPTARPWGTSSRRSGPRASAGDSAIRASRLSISGSPCATALSPSGDSGAYPGVSARGRGPRRGPRRPASAGAGLALSVIHFYSMGAYDQAIAAAQRALALATAGGDVVLHALANLASAKPPWPRATIVGRSTASGRPWRPSRGRGAASASAHPSCPP